MSAAPSIFGRIVSAYDVEAWILDTLKKWSSTYLAEVERQHGYDAGHFQRVRGWQAGPTFDKFPEDQIPVVVVQVIGTVEPPKRDGSGTYRATWLVQLDCICVSNSQARSHEQALSYLAAHREILDNHGSLEGRANGVTWLGEDYTDLPFDDVRSIGFGQATFRVEVHDVGSANAGPATPDVPLDPDTDPWPDWPAAETVDVEVDKKEEAA